MADIASELGMSPANIYRFFPSRDAINESICKRVVNEVADIASAIARTNATASEKLDRLLTAVHHHNKTTLVKEKHMHDMIVAAMQENWATIKAHIERMVTIFEAIIRSLKQGQKIELRGFGSFRLRERGARIGRNPKTGVKVNVPAKKIPYFKPGKELKELINK